MRSALINSGYDFPARRITVNLAPVELSKRGARFDLPIALGVLIASGQLRGQPNAAFECYGELGLSGELKPVRGLFLSAVHASQAQHTLIVPRANLEEIALSGMSSVHGVEHLRSASALFATGSASVPLSRPHALAAPMRLRASAELSALAGDESAPSLSSIVGQWRAKRALVIAATGGHSLLLVGPPGSGKSLLASCLPTLRPPLAADEALELARVASLAGRPLDPRVWR